MHADRKAVWGWALYDWANSAFATTVMAGFFPVFFKQYWSHGADVNLSTAQLALGNSLAGIAMALLAPVLGAVADRSAATKRLLLLFAYLGVLATAALYWVERGCWQWAIVLYAIGVVGFSGANVFYDALLPSVAPAGRLDTVSSLGYALGYLGGGLLFLVNVLMATRPEWFGIADGAAAVRLAFVSVAVWWGGFTPVHARLGAGARRRAGAPRGVPRRRGRAARAARHRRPAAQLPAGLRLPGRLLVLHRRGGHHHPHGGRLRPVARVPGIGPHHGAADRAVRRLPGRDRLRPDGAAPGAATRRSYIGIAVYMGVTVWGTVMSDRTEFYVMAVVIGLVQGGVQALSRSYYARLIPPDKPAEFFGFYNMLGKFASVVGPALMGGVGLLVRGVLMPDAPTAEQLTRVGQTAARWGIASILVLFVAGAVLLYFVKEPPRPESGAAAPPRGC